MTALARVEGVPIGVVATQPAVLAGSLDPLSSQKLTEHLELCSRLGLPLLTIVDTPGFLPGIEAEEAGTVRQGARVVAAYASYEAQAGPLLTLVTRRAYGGAYVGLGSRGLAGGRTGVWPARASASWTPPAPSTSSTGAGCARRGRMVRTCRSCAAR